MPYSRFVSELSLNPFGSTLSEFISPDLEKLVWTHIRCDRNVVGLIIERTKAAGADKYGLMILNTDHCTSSFICPFVTVFAALSPFVSQPKSVAPHWCDVGRRRWTWAESDSRDIKHKAIHVATSPRSIVVTRAPRRRCVEGRWTESCQCLSHSLHKFHKPCSLTRKKETILDLKSL